MDIALLANRAAEFRKRLDAAKAAIAPKIFWPPSTNYWLLSDAGFRRLLQRSNWEICDYQLIGAPGETGAIGEQRAFTLVRSRFAVQATYLLLGRGWHEPEQGGWRWTEQNFAVRFEGASIEEPAGISLTVFVPEALIEAFGVLTLSACANGIDLAPESFSTSTEHVYRRQLAEAPALGGDIRIDFSLNHALPPDANDPSERYCSDRPAAGIRPLSAEIAGPDNFRRTPPPDARRFPRPTRRRAKDRAPRLPPPAGPYGRE